MKKEKTRIYWVRFFVFLCLVATAIIIGYGVYKTLSMQQESAQKEQYYSLARKIESSTLVSLHTRRDSLILTSSMMLHFCPNVTMWPNCNVPSSILGSIASPLSRMSLLRSLSIAAVVQPSQVASFEAFSYDFYVTSGRYPAGEDFHVFFFFFLID